MILYISLIHWNVSFIVVFFFPKAEGPQEIMDAIWFKKKKFLLYYHAVL